MKVLHPDGETDRQTGWNLTLAKSQPGFGREGCAGACNSRPGSHDLKRLLQHDRSLQTGDLHGDGEQVALLGRVLQIGCDPSLFEVLRFGRRRRQFPSSLGAFEPADALQAGAFQKELLAVFFQVGSEREIGELRQRGMNFQGEVLRFGAALGDRQPVAARGEPRRYPMRSPTVPAFRRMSVETAGRAAAWRPGLKRRDAPTPAS